MYLKPSQIFFTQDSIGNRFGGGSHRKKYIGETLDDICNGSCSVRSIPRITVVKKDNKWFTLDNRRLWVFRHLERLGKCTEIEVNVGTYIPSSKLTTANGGINIGVRRGSPGGSWYYKPSVIQIHITSEAKPEASSTPSSTDKDIEKPKIIASEGIIKAKAHTDNNDQKGQSHNKDWILDNQNATAEPNKIARYREQDKLSTGLSMSSHISRQAFFASVASIGRRHLTGATNLGEPHQMKRKRSVSPRVDVCGRNKSGGAIIDRYPFSHQTGHHKRACLLPTNRRYNIDSNNSPISAEMLAMVQALNEPKQYQNWTIRQRSRSYFRTALNQSSMVPSFPVQGFVQPGTQHCVAKGIKINSMKRPDMRYTHVKILDDVSVFSDESDSDSSYTSYEYMIDSADESDGDSWESESANGRDGNSFYIAEEDASVSSSEKDSGLFNHVRKYASNSADKSDGDNLENDSSDESHGDSLESNTVDNSDGDSWESDSAHESDYDSFCIVQEDANDSVDGRDSESVHDNDELVSDRADKTDGDRPYHANGYASNSSDESDSDSSESERENESDGDSFYHAREHVSDSADENDGESFYHVDSWLSLFGCAF